MGNNADKGKAKAQDEASESPPRKKVKKGPIQYGPCGRGEFCTCAICKKAKDQQVYILLISFLYLIYFSFRSALACPHGPSNVCRAQMLANSPLFPFSAARHLGMQQICLRGAMHTTAFRILLHEFCAQFCTLDRAYS